MGVGVDVPPPARVSEVFRVEWSHTFSGPMEVRAFDANETDQYGDGVSLGAVNLGDEDNPSMVEEFGFGPHRLIKSGGYLGYVNTRVPGSGRTLVKNPKYDEDKGAGPRLLPGF